MKTLYTIRFFEAGEHWYAYRDDFINVIGMRDAHKASHFEEDEASSYCLTAKENGYHPIMEIVTDSIL